MAKMTAQDARWCRHFGVSGKGKDQERRAIKRGKKAKTELKKELAQRD